VDHQVTCSDNNGKPITCPTASAIDVQTGFTNPQSIVNPGYLTTPIQQNQWQNIFNGIFGQGPLITVKGKTSGFSEFVAVDLGAGNPQGQANFQILTPTFPVTYSQGQVIPISFQLTSVVPPQPTSHRRTGQHLGGDDRRWQWQSRATGCFYESQGFHAGQPRRL
jgi:hypothetical protein